MVQLILNANPQALFCQDSEGWTPLHVALLYSSDDNLSLMLIRRGGPAAVSIQSKVVGTPLHFAMRHNCSTAVIAELLRTNPSMATTANEYSTKPARILWHQYARNPDNERLLQEILDNNYQQSLPHQGNHHHQSITELTDRLALLLQTVNDKQRTRDNHQDIDRMMMVHHVVEATEETLGDLSQYVPVVVLLYPTSVQSRDEHGNLPLHKAAANRTSCSATSQNCDRLRRSVSLPSFTSEGWDKFDGNNNHQTYSHGGDPIAVLLQSYPVAARIPDGQGHMPLHLALAKGRRTWRTGVAAIVLAAPESVTARCSETELYPFQLAAMNESQCCSSNRSKCSCRENSLEVVETILELLLACPHVLTTSIDGGHRSNRKRRSQ